MIRVLAGDIRGPVTALSLFVGESAGELRPARQQRFESRAFSGLAPILGEFLHGERVDAAGFALCASLKEAAEAGSDAAWALDPEGLSRVLGTRHCALLDVPQAGVLGVASVAEGHRVWLQQAPIDAAAPVALVTVGSGFGRAFMVPGGQAFATEAGHTGFAARNTIERRLLAYLADRHEHVSVERVLSEPGLRLLYDFIVHEGLAPATALFEIERAEDPSGEISRLGARDLDEACAAAVAFFVDLLGAELGNIALETLARGGLYLWGSLPRKLRSVLERGDLLDAFLDKGRMRGVLATVPVALIDDPELALLGARQAALQRLG